MSDVLTLHTASSEETERVGENLTALLPMGAVVALRGELAAGKTCLVRGMARAGAKEATVSSPTFTIVNQYGALQHLDLYRLDLEEVIDLGYEELFEIEGICVIEWAERAENLLPQKRVDITLEHAGHDHRRITIINHGLLPSNWTTQLSPLAHQEP